MYFYRKATALCAVPLHQMSEEEYLLFEAQATDRHEYYQGEVFAMAGGSLEHARIMINASGEIRQRLKGKRCEALRIESIGAAISISEIYDRASLMQSQ